MNPNDEFREFELIILAALKLLKDKYESVLRINNEQQYKIWKLEDMINSYKVKELK